MRGRGREEYEKSPSASLRANPPAEDLGRSSGFEPPRYCYRQPLKLVRLPVPPRPHRSKEYIVAAQEKTGKARTRYNFKKTFYYLPLARTDGPAKPSGAQKTRLGRPSPQKTKQSPDAVLRLGWRRRCW